MRSRWFHPPSLHRPASGIEKRATWLELFYDLVFVAAFVHIGNGLSENVSIEGFGGFALIFTPMWVAWTGVTFYVNRFTVDDFTHRLIIFLQMFAVVAMAVAAPDALAGRHRSFALAYAVAQGMVALLYLRTWYQNRDGRDYCRYWGVAFGGGALLWAASALVPPPYHHALWAVGLLFVMAAPFTRRSRTLNQHYAWDEEHLGERYGLLTLIVIGESFVKVVTSIGGASDLGPILQASLTLLVTCCIWWVYFDDIAGSRVREVGLAPLIWLYSHLPLQIGITATGIAIKKAVHFDLGEIAPRPYRWLLAGALALTFAAAAVIDSVTERRQAELSDRIRVNVRAASAVLTLLLAPAAAGMTAGMFLALITSVCVAQVVFDMMMAPLEAPAKHEQTPTVADVIRERTRTGASMEMLRPRILDAVRLGAPSDLRRDVYFYFMEGGWFRFLAALGFAYIMANVFFAALYSLSPGCIANARTDSFADAFFFSVQTLSTIGYGAMSPATEYGNAIVACEAAVGLLGVAVATGLAFSKVSRAKASVLFSKQMVVSRLRGQPTLIFRCGNARGNEVVDASMTVTALIDELSPEGDHLRRLHDLKLSRDRSPIFILTWVVMHQIDEESPLHGMDLERLGDRLVSIIVTLMGHDGTYNQTVYARMTYYPENIQVGQRFVDVISQLPDGRMQVDYNRFHDTFPEVPQSAAPKPPTADGEDAA